MYLNKIFFLGCLSLMKIISGFILFRYITVNLGVSKLPMLGHVLTISGITTFLTIGGSSRAFIYFSTKNEEKAHSYKYAVNYILLLFSAFLCIVFLIFSNQISFYLIGNNSLALVVKVIGVSSIIFGFNNLAFSYAAICDMQKKAAVVSIVGIVASLFLVLFFLQKEPTFFIYYPVFQNLFIFMGMIYFFRSLSTGLQSFFTREKLYLALAQIKDLLVYSISIISYLFSTYFILTFLRSFLLKKVGFENTGIWEIGQKISDGYMQFFGLLMIYIILPQLIKKQSLLKNIRKYLLLFYLFLFIGFVIFLFNGEFILEFLFGLSADSLELANNIVLLFIVNDIFRITYILMQHVNLARNKIGKFILIEGVNILIIVGGFYLLNISDLNIYMKYYICLNGILMLVSIFIALVNIDLQKLQITIAS